MFLCHSVLKAEEASSLSKHSVSEIDEYTVQRAQWVLQACIGLASGQQSNGRLKS